MTGPQIGERTARYHQKRPWVYLRVVDLLEQMAEDGAGPQSVPWNTVKDLIRATEHPYPAQPGERMSFGNEHSSGYHDLLRRQRPELYRLLRLKVEATPVGRRPVSESERRRRETVGDWQEVLTSARESNLVNRLAWRLTDAQESGDVTFAQDALAVVSQARAYLQRMEAVLTDPQAAHRGRTDRSERDDMRGL